MWLWPVLKFWEDSPLQWGCKILWNLSELLHVRLPFAGVIFGVIMGKQGKKVR